MRNVTKDQAYVKTLLVMAILIGGTWLLYSIFTAPSAGDREAAVYDHLQATKAAPAERCQQAKIVE